MSIRNLLSQHTAGEIVLAIAQTLIAVPVIWVLLVLLMAL